MTEDTPKLNKVYYRPNGTPYVKKYEHDMWRKGQLYDTVVDIKARLLDKTGQDVPLKIIYLVIKYFTSIVGETLAKGLIYKINNLGVFKPLVVKEQLMHNLGGKEEWRKVETHLSYTFLAYDNFKKKLRSVSLKNPEVLENLPKKEKEKLAHTLHK